MTRISRYLAPAPARLAALLSAPVDDNEPLADHAAVIARLGTGARRRGARTRLDAFVVEHGSALRSTPFEWSARTARRSLGTRASHRVVDGEASDVLSAVENEIERQCDRARCGLARPGALGAWLLGASRSLRSTCAVEAASWASGLLALLAPERTGVRVGIADAWFDVPGVPVTLHARRDGASPRSPGCRGGILRCADGTPGPGAIDGLVVDGLVTGLAAHDGLAPSRVLGAWPDAGIVLAVELDQPSLDRAVDLLEEAGGLRPGAARGLELVAA